MQGDDAPWDLHARLLAEQLNATRVLVWQNTKDATATTPKHFPEPIGPPSATAAEPAKPRLSRAALLAFKQREEARNVG